MIIPVRCFTCGKLLGNKYLEYCKRVKEKKLKLNIKEEQPSVLTITEATIKKTPEGEALDELGLIHLCCRTKMLTHIDLTDDI